MADKDMENSTLLYELAHDMRAPLSAINGYANAILDGTVPPEDQKRYIGIIADESKALSRMIDSVLSAARLQSGAVALDMSRFDLSQLVWACLGRLDSAVQYKEIKPGIQLDSAVVSADKALIQSVVTNLLENAFKYTSDGTVSVKLARVAEGVRFAVSNPCGNLRQDEVDRLGERFYRASGARESGVKGTGLGLYISEKALALHGTRLETKLENGSICFSFVL